MNAKHPQMQTLLLVVVFTILGGAAGFYLGTGPTAPSAPVSVAAVQEGRVEAVDSQTFEPLNVASQSEVAARLLAATTETDAHKRRHDVYEIVAMLDSDGIANALSDSEKFGAYARDLVRAQLLSRWVGLDANAAFEWTDKLPLQQRNYLMREFFDSLALKKPGQLVAFLQREKERPTSGEGFAMEAFSTWASRAPSDAVDAALQIDKLAGRNALYGAFKRWGQIRPQDAFLRLQTLPEAERASVTGLVFSAWAERDVAAAMEAAQSLTDVGFRRDAIGKIIAKVGERDLVEGARMLDGLPVDDRLRILEVVASTGYWDNPRFGAIVLSRLPASKESSRVSQLAYQLARANPQEAIEWAEGLRSEEARKSARRSVVIQWAEVDPKAAFEYELQNPIDNNPYSNSSFSRWSGKDPEAAWQWLQKMPDSQGKENAMSSMIASFARKSPERALQEAAKIPIEKRAATMQSIAGAWAANDHEAALNWAVGLPENERYGSVGAAVRTLAYTDVSAATRWIQKQPDVKLRDFATREFATAVVEADPGTALKWAMTISDQAGRDYALTHCARQWSRDDAAAFAAWQAKGNVLPENVLLQVKRQR